MVYLVNITPKPERLEQDTILHTGTAADPETHWTCLQAVSRSSKWLS